MWSLEPVWFKVTALTSEASFEMVVDSTWLSFRMLKSALKEFWLHISCCMGESMQRDHVKTKEMSNGLQMFEPSQAWGQTRVRYDAFSRDC